MQTDFYGIKEDKKLILDFIFSETNYQVFDDYSNFGEELKRYLSTDEIFGKFDLENGKQYEVTFGLWNSLDGTQNILKRIELNPKYCDGHTFRYSSLGWGVQRLYFGGIQNGFLNPSEFIGFNEKGAISKDQINPVNKREAHTLDWKLIRSDQRKLKNYIEKKLGVEKHYRGIILQNARQLLIKNEIKIRQ